jgi:hypothetical protein
MAFLEGAAEAAHVAELVHDWFEMEHAINGGGNPGKNLAHLADEKISEGADHLVPGAGVIRRVVDGGGEHKGAVESLFDGLF